MDILKTIGKVIVGVIFWGYILALMFVEDTYNPFATDKDTLAAVEAEVPAVAENRQSRPPPSAAPVGISIFTSTDAADRASQQLHFSGVLPEGEAKQAAARRCQEQVSHTGGDLQCSEVTFFTTGCFVRYRVGNGQYAAFGATQVEAGAEAERKCQVGRGDSRSSCVRDTNICIGGGQNIGTRSWYYSAVGMTEKFRDHASSNNRIKLFFSPGHSRDDALSKLDETCRSNSGASCKKVIAIDGDRCVAFAINLNGGYSIQGGTADNESQLKARAKERCQTTKGGNCYVGFHCAE